MFVVFAMGALGALLGVWIAWSQSPIVVTVLPLLFGVIGGAGGYSLLKMDFSKPQNHEKLRVIGLGLGSLCLACLIFMVGAILVRPALRGWATSADPDITGSISPFRSLMLRARLQALGATEKEIELILKPPPSNLAMKDRIPLITKDASDYFKAYETVPVTEQSALESGYQDASPGKIAINCKIFLAESVALAASGRIIDDSSAALLLSRLISMKFDAEPNTLGREAEEGLIKYPSLLAARIRLVVDLQAATAISDVVLSSQEIAQADKIIPMLTATQTKSHDPLSIAFTTMQYSR